jgi:hypothetical protein
LFNFSFSHFNIQKRKYRDHFRQDKNSAIIAGLPFSIGHSFFPTGDALIAHAKNISCLSSANGGFQAMKSGLEFPVGDPGNPHPPG